MNIYDNEWYRRRIEISTEVLLMDKDLVDGADNELAKSFYTKSYNNSRWLVSFWIERFTRYSGVWEYEFGKLSGSYIDDNDILPKEYIAI